MRKEIDTKWRCCVEAMKAPSYLIKVILTNLLISQL